MQDTAASVSVSDFLEFFDGAVDVVEGLMKENERLRDGAIEAVLCAIKTRILCDDVVAATVVVVQSGKDAFAELEQQLALAQTALAQRENDIIELERTRDSLQEQLDSANDELQELKAVPKDILVTQDEEGGFVALFEVDEDQVGDEDFSDFGYGTDPESAVGDLVITRGYKGKLNITLESY